MRRFTITAMAVLQCALLLAQQPVFLQNFEQLPIGYSKGVVGKALDLTAANALRKPMLASNPLADYTGNFTVAIRVKAATGARQQYVILQNSRYTNDSSFSWEIGMQPSGAWYCQLWQREGKSLQYNYSPTIKQSIKDSKWHSIVFSYDTVKQEAAFYFDGHNTALLHTPGLKKLMYDSLIIGGQMQGLLNEWESFNGSIDDVELYNMVLDSKQVMQKFGRESTKYPVPEKAKQNIFKVMNYNILHGGHETGKEVGVQRIIEVIKASGADIISMQETYGSGPEIADALGYYFYLRSSNLAVYSRYPIETSVQAGRPFNSGGVVIKMPGNRRILFFTNWLTYPFDYWEELEQKHSIDSADWYQQQDTVNAENLRRNLRAIAPSLAMAEREEVPVIFCGDFNTGSHLDWTEATRHLNNGYVMPFPTTQIMQQQGFTDSYRQMHPDPLKDRGITWSPMFPSAFKDRIDYIFYRSSKVKPVSSVTISQHPIRYPSDHAALVTSFEWTK